MTTVKKLKKVIKNGVEYELGGGIESSNNTYDNIIHLSQSEYDNLSSYDSDTLYSTPEGEGESYVDNTAYGSSWDGKTGKAPSQNAVYDKISSMDTDINNKITAPSGGDVGDVLKKTANGTEWGTVSVANPITLEYVETVDITFSSTLEGQTFPKTYNYLVYVVCIPNYSNIYTVGFDLFQNTLRSGKQSCKNVFLRPGATIQYDTFNGTGGSVTVKCYVYKVTLNI